MDVKRQALVDRLLDRGNPLIGAGDLDHHVRAVEALPVVTRLCEGALRVMREIRCDLERHEPVAVLLEHGAQDVGRVLDVGHGDLFVDRERVEAVV